MNFLSQGLQYERSIQCILFNSYTARAWKDSQLFSVMGEQPWYSSPSQHMRRVKVLFGRHMVFGQMDLLKLCAVLSTTDTDSWLLELGGVGFVLWFSMILLGKFLVFQELVTKITFPSFSGGVVKYTAWMTCKGVFNYLTKWHCLQSTIQMCTKTQVGE